MRIQSGLRSMSLIGMILMGMRAVATDGHRLAFFEYVEVHAACQADAILPRKSVLELLRLLGDSEHAGRQDAQQTVHGLAADLA